MRHSIRTGHWSISIHALREEGDYKPRATRMVSSVFLSTPSARRATEVPVASGCGSRFLSTPSARRATGSSRLQNAGYSDFYPRPPRGGRLTAGAWSSPLSLFLSTPSARRATQQLHQFFVCHVISIHALREEGDRIIVQHRNIQYHFYPRPPRGGRPAK